MHYTLANPIAAPMSNGDNDRITSDNFHPLIRPIIIPLKNVEVYCNEFPNLSDNPSFILSTSLN